LDSLNLFRGRNTNQEHGPETRPVVPERGLTALFQIENVPLGDERPGQRWKTTKGK